MEGTAYSQLVRGTISFKKNHLKLLTSRLSCGDSLIDDESFFQNGRLLLLT